MHRILLGGLLIFSVLLSWNRPAVAQDITIEHWQGEYPVAELHRFVEDQEVRGIGYIANQGTWESIWEGFQSTPAPAVDFPSEVVVYARNVDFVNIISPLSVSLNEQGIAEVLAATTLTARPIEDFVYWSAATIPSGGVLQLSNRGNLLAVQVPEPAGVSLAGAALVGLVVFQRKKRG